MDNEKSNTKPTDPKVWDKPRRFIIATVPIYKKLVTKTDEKSENPASFRR